MKDKSKSAAAELKKTGAQRTTNGVSSIQKRHKYDAVLGPQFAGRMPASVVKRGQ